MGTMPHSIVPETPIQGYSDFAFWMNQQVLYVVERIVIPQVILQMHEMALPIATQLWPSSPRKYPSAHEQLSLCPSVPSLQKCSQPPFSSWQVVGTSRFSKNQQYVVYWDRQEITAVCHLRKS